MKKRKINYLGFLSLLSLIAVLGWTTKNIGFYGFFGFLYYVRYFWVIPDELFILHVQKSATAALFFELISLVPFLFLCTAVYTISKATPIAFGLSFGVAIAVFSVALVIYEWKERRGAIYD